MAKNAANKGISLSVYNRWTEAEKEVIPTLQREVPNNLIGFTNLSSFVASLATPRSILLMVNAGDVVDTVLDQLTPLLSKGDVLLDGGNSHYSDTQKRVVEFTAKGIYFLGIGISGGEQGALTGPSMMVGGLKKAYQQVSPILEAISAKDGTGNPCVSLVGTDGCGHFVKTIHNGIEYAEMQLLAECYDLLKQTYSYEEIAHVFREWNKSDVQSYLLGITAEILVKKDGNDYLLNKVLDKAGSKGTGSWSSQVAFQLGVPASMINAAVTARYISTLKEKRVSLSKKIAISAKKAPVDVKVLKEAYTFARIINHYQGFEIIKAAAIKNNWTVDLSEIARIWTAGCIIKSTLMEKLSTIFKERQDLLMDKTLLYELETDINSTKKIIKYSLNQDISINCISESYNYFISIITARSSANLIQAQRDEFGAHTYRRIDQPTDQSFTTNWTTNG